MELMKMRGSVPAPVAKMDRAEFLRKRAEQRAEAASKSQGSDDSGATPGIVLRPELALADEVPQPETDAVGAEGTLQPDAADH
jgi:hypothetical protein